MPLYRKKPVVIEAMQFTEETKNQVFNWVRGNRAPATDEQGNSIMRIQTLEGVMTVSPGDYVIKGVEGEIYPCKPEIFAKTYALVEEAEDGNPICLHMNTSTEYVAEKTTCQDCGHEAPL